MWQKKITFSNAQSIYWSTVWIPAVRSSVYWSPSLSPFHMPRPSSYWDISQCGVFRLHQNLASLSDWMFLVHRFVCNVMVSSAPPFVYRDRHNETAYWTSASTVSLNSTRCAMVDESNYSCPVLLSLHSWAQNVPEATDWLRMSNAKRRRALSSQWEASNTLPLLLSFSLFSPIALSLSPSSRLYSTHCVS